MTKMKLKKIDNKAARQVTFSKRRNGLFKKAEQLGILCGANVAALIFSAAGRPYTFSSTSMNDIVKRYEMSTNKSNKEDEMDLEDVNNNYAILCKEAMKKSNELRQMNGEGRQGLDLEELQNLEYKMETCLRRVLKMKEKHFINKISSIQQQMDQLVEENNKLRQGLITSEGKHPLGMEVDNTMQEDGRLSNSSTDNGPPVEDSYVTLKLGLPSSS